MGHWLRQPKTTQERRENGKRCQHLWFEDYRVKCRAARSLARLPEHRDDYVRQDLKNRSWKRHRSTQYKSL